MLGILNPNIEAAFPATPGPGATHHHYSLYHLQAPPCRLAAFVTTAYAQQYKGGALSGTKTHVKPFLGQMELMLALKDSSLSWTM